MNKLNVGDKIKVREDLIPWIKFDDVLCTSDMIKFAGKTGNITKVCNSSCYRINVDDETFFWSDIMFQN